MKNTKRILATLMTIIMLVGLLAVPAMAAGTGTISVESAQQDVAYTVYKIFDLEYNTTTGAYRYVLNSTWTDFKDYSYDLNGDSTAETIATYFDFTTTDGKTYVTSNSTDSATAAKLLAQYVKDKKVSGTTISGSTDGFTYGYYLLTSSLGTLCALDTLVPEKVGDTASISLKEKNNLPAVSKTVDKENASLDETLTYTITVDCEPGALNYCLTDTLPAGITFTEITSVKHNTSDVATTKYSVTTPTEGSNVLTVDLSTYCAEATIKADDTLVVTYTAKLNKSAVIGTTGNKNTVVLSYGANGTLTKQDNATVTTGEFTVSKVDPSNTSLTGAKFKLYDALTGGNEIPVVEVSEGIYRKALSSETGVEIEAGTSKVQGLADGTYHLEETKAPDGYNKLSERKAVEIKDTTGSITIENKTGVALPETGGMGTTLFYVAGGALVLGAFLVLMKKRGEQK